MGGGPGCAGGLLADSHIAVRRLLIYPLAESAGRVLKVLESFGPDDRDVSLGEIAGRVGLPKSSVHRLLATLVAHQLVERDSQTRRYRLGIRLFELGSAAIHERGLHSAAHPALQQLSASTGETCHLAVLSGTEAVYVYKLDGPSSIVMSSRVGGRAPCHATSIGMEQPRPRAGEALVQVLACGLCFSDVKTIRGRMPYSASLRLPHVAGHEVSGRVVEVNGPSPFHPGQRVVVYHVWGCHRCAACRRGEEHLCTDHVAWMGFTHPGGFREYLTAPVEYLLPVPETIPPTVAPALTCAMGTAYRAVAVRGRLLPGEVAVVLGLGGVGVHAALIAQAAGVRVVGVDLGAAKLDAARRSGLDTVIASEEASERIRSLAPDGVDAVLETTGVPGLLEQARRMLRPGGRVVGVGYEVDELMAVSSDQLVLLEQSVNGSRHASRIDIEHVIRMVANGTVRPVIGEILPLERLNDGIERLEAGKVNGRLVFQLQE